MRFIARSGSSGRAAPTATTPTEASPTAARAAVAAIFSLVMSRPLRMVRVRAAAAVELAPPVAAATAARPTPPGTAALAREEARTTPSAARSRRAGQAPAQLLPRLRQPAAQRRHGPWSRPAACS